MLRKVEAAVVPVEGTEWEAVLAFEATEEGRFGKDACPDDTGLVVVFFR